MPVIGPRNAARIAQTNIVSQGEMPKWIAIWAEV